MFECLLSLFQAEQFQTKRLDEDGLLDLIRTMPEKVSKFNIQARKAVTQVSLGLFVFIYVSSPNIVGSVAIQAMHTIFISMPVVIATIV